MRNKEIFVITSLATIIGLVVVAASAYIDQAGLIQGGRSPLVLAGIVAVVVASIVFCWIAAVQASQQ